LVRWGGAGTHRLNVTGVRALRIHTRGWADSPRFCPPAGSAERTARFGSGRQGKGEPAVRSAASCGTGVADGGGESRGVAESWALGNGTASRGAPLRARARRQ
jgi:hypothetical protein